LFFGASKSWMKRTPRSTSRRAIRHCRPNISVAGLSVP
jgi:hypothetical protein